MIQTFYHPWHSGLFLPTVAEHIQITTSTIFAQHKMPHRKLFKNERFTIPQLLHMYC